MVLRNCNDKSENELLEPLPTNPVIAKARTPQFLKQELAGNLARAERMGQVFAHIWLAAYRGALSVMPDQLEDGSHEPAQAAAACANEVLTDYRMSPKMPKAVE